VKLRVAYNAPVVLTFALIALVVTCLPVEMRAHYFSSHGKIVDWSSYLGMVTHIFGHANWQHYIGNFTMILLLGPILEERHGSTGLLTMILITALVASGIGLLVGHASLGASGVVFMMILLASTANIREGEIPLTFIAIATIYLGGEIYAGLTKDDNISHLGHLIGGLAGAAFGFFGAKGGRKPVSVSDLGMPAAKHKLKT
jgi:rhomboid protease GluP